MFNMSHFIFDISHVRGHFSQVRFLMSRQSLFHGKLGFFNNILVFLSSTGGFFKTIVLDPLSLPIHYVDFQYIFIVPSFNIINRPV